MKLANLRGRATIVTETGVVDVHAASGGQLPHDPDRAVLMLSDISDWYRRSHPRPDRRLTAGSLLADPAPLGPPVVNPSQIFAIGLNYSAHAAETGRTLPAEPLVFTKYASALAGPGDAIVLPTDTCDWEVELVVVMGRVGRAIPVDGALKFVAGYCVGQDVSERHGQMAGERPQFGLAKSHRGFAPIGPWLTTLDELHDPTDLAISAAIDAHRPGSANLETRHAIWLRAMCCLRRSKLWARFEIPVYRLLRCPLRTMPTPMLSPGNPHNGPSYSSAVGRHLKRDLRWKESPSPSTANICSRPDFCTLIASRQCCVLTARWLPAGRYA